MNYRYLMIFLFFLSGYLYAQRQIDVQGSTTSVDTVATINTNYVGSVNVVGLSVKAKPHNLYGIGGYFYGGKLGLNGVSEFGTGVIGESESGVGIQGLSNSNTGVHGESYLGYGVHGFSIFSDGIFGLSTQGNGIYGLSTSLAGVYGLSPSHVGVRGQSQTGIGVQGLSDTGKGVRGESTRIGVLGTSISDSLITIFVDGRIGVVGYSDDTIGVYGVATAKYGQGLKGEALGEIGTGVLGVSLDSIGIGVTGKGSAFDFNAVGPGIDYYSSSSQRWKNNITIIPDPLEKINALRGVYFDWDEAHGGRHDIGMIAEEVGEIIPEIVSYEANGTDASGMDYSRLTPLLLEAIKALNDRIDDLELLVTQGRIDDQLQN